MLFYPKILVIIVGVESTISADSVYLYQIKVFLQLSHMVNQPEGTHETYLHSINYVNLIFNPSLD